MARRFLRIVLPALVFMRARKPCLRFRRRVLGWNVRFVIGKHLGLNAPK